MNQWKSVASKLILVIFAGVLFFSGQTNTYAAAVGTKLIAPEAGWKRYDDTIPAIKYEGIWTARNSGSQNDPFVYLGTDHYTTSIGAKASFKFKGTKIRLLAQQYSGSSANITVKVDGTAYTYSAKATTNIGMVLLFERLNLTEAEHSVEIISNDTLWTEIDAIDIDDTGYLVASVGSQLTTPEDGWKRYDDMDSAIVYSDGYDVSYRWLSVNLYNGSASPNSNSTLPATNKGKVRFKFVGTKFRIIAVGGSNRASNVDIYVDGVKNSFALNNTSTTNNWQTVSYERLDLQYGVHEIVMNNFVPSVTTNTPFGLDAIDIDATGYLINPNLSAPVDLSASAAIEKVDLSWTAVTNATSYNVKRSTTTGGPYETIASNVTNATYNDINVTSDVKYYYVVTAVNATGESISSNETSAIPLAATVPDNGRAILTIYLNNGTEKEYDLSMTEVNAFIDWYDQKDAGVGTAKYTFIKTWNKGPFAKRTEYIVFDKILTFNVDEYASEE